MKSWFFKLKLTSGVMAILSLIFGITLLVDISISNRVVIILLGCLVLAYGIVAILNYFMYGYESFGFTAGVMYVMLGVFIIGSSHILVTQKVFAFICGFILFIRAMFRIPNFIEYRKNRIKYWWLETLAIACILTIGIIVMCDPFSTTFALLKLLGFGLIADSLFKIAIAFCTSGKIKRTRHTLRELFLLDDAD